MRRPRRWIAPVVMAATAGALVPQQVEAAAAGAGADVQPASPPITVEELLGPDGEPLEGAGQINQAGQVVARDALGSVVLWHRGTATVVATSDIMSGRVPVDISERGQVVGNQIGMPFLRPGQPWSWRDGELTGLTPAQSSGFVVGVSDRGQILGVRRSESDPSVAETVVWQDGQVILAPAEARSTADVYHLDNRGRALVGVDGDPEQPDTQRAAAVWRIGGGLTELGTLGGAESFGSAINDRGHVAGVGQTASGEWHAFL